jgi:hypothetical protein
MAFTYFQSFHARIVSSYSKIWLIHNIFDIAKKSTYIFRSFEIGGEFKFEKRNFWTIIWQINTKYIQRFISVFDYVLRYQRFISHEQSKYMSTCGCGGGGRREQWVYIYMYVCDNANEYK